MIRLLGAVVVSSCEFSELLSSVSMESQERLLVKHGGGVVGVPKERELMVVKVLLNLMVVV